METLYYFSQVDFDKFVTQDQFGEPYIEVNIPRMNTSPFLLGKYKKIRKDKYLYHFFGEKSLLNENYLSSSELEQLYGPKQKLVLGLFQKCFDALSWVV